MFFTFPFCVLRLNIALNSTNSIHHTKKEKNAAANTANNSSNKNKIIYRFHIFVVPENQSVPVKSNFQTEY